MWKLHFLSCKAGDQPAEGSVDIFCKAKCLLRLIQENQFIKSIEQLNMASSNKDVWVKTLYFIEG